VSPDNVLNRHDLLPFVSCHLKNAGVRKASVHALQKLYDADDNVPTLGLFTERFSNRMIELADDSDVSVAVCAIGLVKQLLRYLSADFPPHTCSCRNTSLICLKSILMAHILEIFACVSYRHQLLPDDDLGPLYDLLIDDPAEVRRAIGELVYDHLIAQKFNSPQSSSRGFSLICTLI
jgi:cohesin complex subunit SA-1/2